MYSSRRAERSTQSPEWCQSHREALFHSFEGHPAYALDGGVEGDKVRQEQPRREKRRESETIQSGRRPEQSRSPVSRLARSTRCCRCWTRLRETDICRDQDPYKKLRGECLRPANRDHARQVCSETSPFAE